jgi:polyferredoxin
MRSRVLFFVVAVVVGGVLGYAWNWPGFGHAYKGFIALFVDTSAPLGTAWAVVLLAFVMGVPRICVP